MKVEIFISQDLIWLLIGMSIATIQYFILEKIKKYKIKKEKGSDK